MQIPVRRMRLAAMSAAQSATTPTGSPSIRSWEIRNLREPVSKRAYAIVRIESSNKIVGYGECAPIRPDIAARAGASLMGMPVTAYETIRRNLAGTPALEAGISMAVLDIMGRQAKAPVYQVLGGPTRNKVRALAAIEPDAASLKRARDAGYRAMLLPAPATTSPNQGQAYVKKVRQMMDSMRSQADDCDFVLDGAGKLTAGDAASLAAELERFRLLWFDEPCRSTNLATIRKIASETVTPLGFGRAIHQAGAFQDLLREEGIDILRPGLGINGLSQIRRMAVLAETYYVAIAPYHDGGPVATTAALHLAASLPNFFIQQIPLPVADEDRRMREEIVTGRPEAVSEGYAQLPTGPGLGITINEDAVRKYTESAA